MTGTLLDVAAALTPALLGAVLAVLAVMSGWTALLAGGFLREAAGRRRHRAALDQAVRLASGGPDRAVETLAVLGRAPHGLAARAARELSQHGLAASDHVLQRLDERVRRVLAAHTLLTRLGPMAGLVATLLPLGPALGRLADGDITALAEDLTIAFTATVVGLVVSCAAFAMGLVRRAWYHDDVDGLELLLLRVAPRGDDTPTATPESMRC